MRNLQLCKSILFVPQEVTEVESRVKACHCQSNVGVFIIIIFILKINSPEGPGRATPCEDIHIGDWSTGMCPVIENDFPSFS